MFPKAVPNSWVGGWRGVWRGGFFCQVVFGVDSGLSMQVFLGWGVRICFPFPQWEGPRCLAYIPFKFGGQEGLFFPVSQCVPTVFPLSSQYVPQFHNVFPNMFFI
jgi:hypothetical protein